MAAELELTNLKIKFLALQKQLINLKQFDLYIDEINTVLNIIEHIELFSLHDIEKSEEQIKLIYKNISEDFNISIQFKRQFIQILKTLLNTLINLSVIKIYNYL